MSDRSSDRDEPCELCGGPIRAFDSAVYEPHPTENRRWQHHTDCEAAAKKDYARIAAIFNRVGYSASRRIWGQYMEETYDLPEDVRTRLDGIILGVVHEIDAGLKEAWSA